jgi:hypothetical protein
MHIKCTVFFIIEQLIVIVLNVNAKVDLKKCVAYPQEEFLFIKLITSFRISLLKNCKKDFQLHIKTTGSKFFYTKYKKNLHDLCEFHIFGLSSFPVAFQTP